MELHELFTLYHEQGSWKTASFDVAGLNDGLLTLSSLFTYKKDIEIHYECMNADGLRCRVNGPGDGNHRLKASDVRFCIIG